MRPDDAEPGRPLSADIFELDDTAIAGAASSQMASAALASGVVASSTRRIFDELPFAIYTVDAIGQITYFNPASVEFAGRLPVLGKDKWCVTWKLFSLSGEFLPHDQCPMAVAVRDGKPVRGARAIAERPNGVRVPFMPFPTPVMDESGKLLGAFNMLLPLDALATLAQAR